jgi:secreted trypsin-like serine protease
LLLNPNSKSNILFPYSDAYPHQISLQLKTILGTSHICGGSIINENYVICAAHCVQGQSKSKLKVRAMFILKVKSKSTSHFENNFKQKA